MLFDHAARLAAMGDVTAARAMTEAALRLADSGDGEPAKVIDLAERRRER